MALVYGTYRAESTPTGANIYLDGAYKGKTNLTIANLTPKTYTVKIKLSGYKTETFPVDIAAGEESLTSTSLEREAPPEIPPTKIKVTLTPSNAIYRVDGSATFYLSGVEYEITAGSHSLSAELMDYITQTLDVAIIREKTNTFSIILSRVPAPEKTWLEKLIDLAIAQGLKIITPKPDLISKAYLLATGKPLTEEEYAKVQLSILDFFLNLDVYLRLFTGKNLKGEDEAFGKPADYALVALDIVGLALFFATPGIPDEIALKAGGKGLLEEAGELALKKATPEQIEAMLKSGAYKHVMDAVRADPSAWAKLMPSLSTEAKSILFASMKQMADPTAYRLAAESVEAAAKLEGLSAVEKVLGVLPGATTGKKLFIAFSSLIGAAAGYIGLAQFLAWTGKEAIKEAISFSGLYLAIDNKNWKLARENLPLLKDAIEAYKKSTALARVIPFIGDIWDKAIEATEVEYSNYETLINEELAKLPGPAGTLKIEAVPANAKISVETQIPATGIFSAELPAGNYLVSISAFGYSPESYTASVAADEETYIKTVLEKAVAPPPLKATLIIKTFPADVNVSVAGIPKITKAGTYTLDAGTYTLDFSYEGYDSERRTVYLAEGETEIVSVSLKLITPAAPLRGSLTILSEPTGASVYIDGKWAGTITPYTVKLDKGLYRIRVEMKGYEIRERDVSLDWEEESSEPFVLVPKELPEIVVPIKKSKILIKSEPTTADIYIDGVYTYVQTPYTALLDAGEYLIRLQKKSYYPTEVTIEVAQEEEGEIILALDKIPAEEVPAEPYVPYVPYAPYYPVPPAITAPIYAEPYYSLPAPDYFTLNPADIQYSTPVDVTAPYARELIVNIETTDVLPFAGKIISIAWIDLSTPEQEPEVITSDNEEDLLKTFLDFFDSKNFTRIVGFNVSFDHRFIFAKAALYRRPCKIWADVGMRDIMQILQQVQEKFVYSLNKAGTLNDWSKHLLGYGKYGTQEEVLARFIRKDFDYVDAFNINQVDIIYDLYALLRFTLSEASLIVAEALQSTISPAGEELFPLTPSLPTTKLCPNCMQENPLGTKNCIVCGYQL